MKIVSSAEQMKGVTRLMWFAAIVCTGFIFTMPFYPRERWLITGMVVSFAFFLVAHALYFIKMLKVHPPK